MSLRDGTPVVIRPLLLSDRGELALAYDRLSDESRHRRFFSPPSRLSQSLLDYLTDLDYDRRFAVGAYACDDPTRSGLGVARWVRSADDRSRAHAAVTVVDDWQGRGLGTLLLARLVEEARAHGVTTFLAEILWENTTLLDPLRDLGARIAPSEPGIASVELDLPARGAELVGTAVHQVLATSAAEASS